MGDAWSANQSSGNKASIQIGLPVGSYPERSGGGATLAVFAVTVLPRLPTADLSATIAGFIFPVHYIINPTPRDVSPQPSGTFADISNFILPLTTLEVRGV